MSKSSLGTILRSMLAVASGRILWRANMYALIGGKFDRRRITANIRIPRGVGRISAAGDFLSKDGTAVIVRRRSVNNCPKPPIEGVYKNENGTYCVPETVCRACTHFKPVGSGYTYARCLARAVNDPPGMVRLQMENAVDSVTRLLK